MRIELVDERDEKSEVFQHEGGLAAFVSYLNRSKTPVHDTVLWFQTRDGNTQVEVAMQWNDSYQESMYCYTNNIPQKDGGTHLAGYRAALTRTLNNYIEKELAAKKEKIATTGDDCARGTHGDSVGQASRSEVLLADQGQAGLLRGEGRGRIGGRRSASRNSCWSIRRRRAQSSTRFSKPPMRAKPRARRAK